MLSPRSLPPALSHQCLASCFLLFRGLAGIFLSNASCPVFLKTSLSTCPFSFLHRLLPPSAGFIPPAYEHAVSSPIFVKPSLTSHPSLAALLLLSTTELLERILSNQSLLPLLPFALKSIPSRLPPAHLHCNSSCQPPEGPSNCLILWFGLSSRPA